MFIPFLAATAVAATFTQLGAMSVQISILTLALKAVSIAFTIVVMATIGLFTQRHQKA